MTRVKVSADVFALEAFEMGGAGLAGGWFKNLGWMLSRIFIQDFVLDIGPVPGTKPRGAWYLMEPALTRFLCN